MNNKYLFTAIAIVVVLIIGLFIYNSSKKSEQVASNTSSSQSANTETQTKTPTPTVENKATTPEEPKAPDGNDVAVFEVNYDGKAFAPSQITIKNGDVVIFKNNSTSSFWPASGPHPAHTNYPAFDPKKSYGPGQSWQFKFTQSGTWPFHDHLNPSAFGKIIVE